MQAYACMQPSSHPRSQQRCCAARPAPEHSLVAGVLEPAVRPVDALLPLRARVGHLEHPVGRVGGRLHPGGVEYKIVCSWKGHMRQAANSWPAARWAGDGQAEGRRWAGRGRWHGTDLWLISSQAAPPAAAAGNGFFTPWDSEQTRGALPADAVKRDEVAGQLGGARAQQAVVDDAAAGLEQQQVVEGLEVDGREESAVKTRKEAGGSGADPEGGGRKEALGEYRLESSSRLSKAWLQARAGGSGSRFQGPGGHAPRRSPCWAGGWCTPRCGPC